MKEKLKTILNTIWNEPRHFFFWLAMLSLFALAAVAVATAQIGPSAPLAFAALGCILCFMASVPAFILAWIPPIRRLFAWLLRWRFLALGCLVTLVALFYAVENWRGRRAWHNFKQEREAKGERFDIADLLPPPVAADQNFFETPLWTDLHFVETNGAVVWSGAPGGSRAIFDAFGPRAANAPSTGNWLKAQRLDLAAWQAFYRGSNNFYSTQGGPPTNYFPIAKEPQSPAADVLLALSKFEGNRQLLIVAAARPQARFWINYDAGFAMLLPHLVRVKAGCQYLALHANAALQAGDRQTAVEDVELMFRLLDSIRGEPILISHLVRMAALQLALGPVWEGLANRQWSETDLRTIASELGKMDFLADYHFAMRGERACGVWGVDYVRRAGIQALGETVELESSARPTDGEKFLGRALFRLIPAGWFDQNKLSLCSLQETCFLTAVDRERRLIPPARIQQSSAMLSQLKSSPYGLLSRLLLPALNRAAERCARAQTSADLARVACALEQYRLARGQFPETLAALAPAFIEKLPHDVINGQPLNYRRAEDGQFVLYSVGWNESDDGGRIELTKSGSNVDPDKGDWVWRYPAKWGDCVNGLPSPARDSPAPSTRASHNRRADPATRQSSSAGRYRRPATRPA